MNYTDQTNQKAIEIHKNLKTTSQMIGFADLLIGASALAKGMKMATLNESHFTRIDGLTVLSNKK